MIVLSSISLVAANTAAMSVRERRVEFAVMRSIGFTAPRVVMLLSAEGALTGVIGGAIGAGVAWIILHLLPLSGDLFGSLGTITMPARVPVAAIVLSTIVGISSGLVPAMLAMRRKVVDELRAIV
jgi:putative ABC transport system permease protein